jgi:hypothetical protein
MARLCRYFLPDQPLDVIQRGNNRAAIFFAGPCALSRLARRSPGRPSPHLRHGASKTRFRLRCGVPIADHGW